MNVSYNIKLDNILLRPLLEDDIEKLRVWRNDQNNNKYLRDIGIISQEQQIEWYKSYLKVRDEVFFAIEETSKFKKIVGALSIYNIDTNSAEVGKIQIGEKEAHGLGIGKKSLVMLMKFGFEVLKLKRIVGVVNKENLPAIINDVAIGFKIVGEQKSQSQNGGSDFLLEIGMERLKSINVYYDNIVIVG